MCSVCSPDESQTDREINCQERPVNRCDREGARMHSLVVLHGLGEAKISGERSREEWERGERGTK